MLSVIIAGGMLVGMFFKERFLRQRADFHPVWDYFLNLLMRSANPGMLREAIGRPLVEHLCHLAPFELFHAMGVHPVRLGSGCHAVGRLSASRFPVLMCPMLKATAGMMQLNARQQQSVATPRVVPTTCDWVVKFPEMTDGQSQHSYYLELPHLHQSEKAQNRWLEELYGLVCFLEEHTGRKLKRKALLTSVRIFMRAWQALGRMIEYKRKGALAGVWFMAVVNSFMLDPIEAWTEHVFKALETIACHPFASAGHGIFLAGSPIVFPTFKLLNLIEAAGMEIYADNLCTSERIWPGAVCFEDASYHGLMRALAERYHKGCICPTFADKERRVNSILNTMQQHAICAVLYHVLKGCHPFDIESFGLEERLTSEGYKFLKIETDYVQEDSQNILMRLEAFKQIEQTVMIMGLAAEGIFVGIDLGSTAIKVVFVEHEEIVWKKAVPMVPGQSEIVDRLTDEGLEATGLAPAQISAVAVTGYGKGLVSGAQKVIDEVSANALGAFLLSGSKARTIINIGGQDVKVIRLSDTGKLINFKMNDKCAAGTGRFFEVAARILDTPVDAFDRLSREVADPVNINSTCALFPESEMVSLMAKGIAKERIIQGLHESVARRIANLAGNRDMEDGVYLDGGSANNRGLVAAIEDELFRDVHVLPYPQFTVAYGAARSL